MAVRKHYLAAALSALAVTAGPAAGSASAGIFLCVPASGAVTSGGTTGSCGTATPVELPQSRADQQTLLSLLQYMSFDAAGVGGKPTITIRGANLRLLNGGGSTTTVNGTGNLVLGYNEGPGTQSGSHNLVLGQSNTFTSFGSIIGGTNNKSTAPFSTVLGYNNTGAGSYSGVFGGYTNQATGFAATVAGGHDNVAKGHGSAVLGGNRNTAESDAATVAGGYSNKAGGIESSVAGGNQNTAAGQRSAVQGGKLNTVNAVNGVSDGTHYWVRMDGNGVKLADSGPLRSGYTIETYDYTNGFSLVWLRGMDVSKCSVSAEPDGSTDVDVAYRYQAGEYVYVQLKRNGQAVDGIGLSVSLDCANPTT